MPLIEISVNVLCGIPASGKSTLAREIVKNHHLLSGYGGASYDDIFTVDYDAMILNKISNRVRDETILSQKIRELWKYTRIKALERLKDIMEETYQKNKLLSSKKIMITLDDNFYLRSMRREVHKICLEFAKSKKNIQLSPGICIQNNNKTYGCKLILPRLRIGFITIHVATPLIVCLIRNAQRFPPHRIPKQILYDMSNLLQLPNPLKANFESYYCSISMVSNETTLLMSDEINDQKNTRTTIFNYVDQNIYHNIKETIIKALNNPVKLKKHQELNHVVQLSIKSSIHLFDIMLRNLVNIICRTDPILKHNANNARRSLLNELINKENTYNKEECLLKFFEKMTFSSSSISSKQLLSVQKLLHLKFLRNFVRN